MLRIYVLRKFIPKFQDSHLERSPNDGKNFPLDRKK